MANTAKPAASAKGDKAPMPTKAKGAAAAVNGAAATAVSLKQMAAGLAEGHDLPNAGVRFRNGVEVKQTPAQTAA